MAKPLITFVFKGWPARGAALLRVGTEFQGSMQAVAARFGPLLVDRARALSPVGKAERIGPRFRDSWVATVGASYRGGATVSLANIAPHAPFVLGDTREHDIWAAHMLGTRSAVRSRSIGPGEQYPLRSPELGLGFLKFPNGRGGFSFRHHVHHPFHKGNPVHERVNVEMQAQYQELLGEQAQALAARIETIFGS